MADDLGAQSGTERWSDAASSLALLEFGSDGGHRAGGQSGTKEKRAEHNGPALRIIRTCDDAALLRLKSF